MTRLPRPPRCARSYLASLSVVITLLSIGLQMAVFPLFFYVLMMFFPAGLFFTMPLPPALLAALFFAAVIRPPLLFFAILSPPFSFNYKKNLIKV